MNELFAAGWQDEALKLVLAIVVGSVVGLEREIRGKPAGMRTMILITLGSTLFTIYSVEMADPWTDRARIAAQIVTGVGFLGAGAILHDRRHVTGLTTAASIWLVAALGIGIGLGAYVTTLATAVAVIFVLLVFARVQKWFDRRRHDETYLIQLPGEIEEMDRLVVQAEECGLRTSRLQIGKNEHGLRVAFRAVGSREAHAVFVRRLVAEERVRSFSRMSHNRAAVA